MTSAPGPAERARRALPAILLGLYALASVSVWFDPRFRPEWDAALYTGLGRSLAAGEGYTYLGAPFFSKPAGVPWLVSRFGAGPFDAAPLNRMIMLFAAAAAAAAGLAVARRRSPWWGVGAALLAGTSPGWVQHFNTILAEFPFVAFGYLGVAALARPPGSRRGGLLGGAIAGALLGASLWFRSVGLLLLPGILLVPLLGRARHALLRAAVACAVAVALAAPWFAYSRSVAASAPAPAEQLLVFDYATAILRTDTRDPEAPLLRPRGWLLRVRDNGAAMLRDAGRNVLGAATLGAGMASAVVFALGLAASARRRPGLLEWLAGSYVALLLVYFTYAPRLLLPLLPLLYLYLLLGLREGIRRLPEPMARREAPLVVAAAVGLLALNAARLPATLHPERWGRGADSVAAVWAEQERVAEWLRRETAADAVVLARPAPALALLAGRRVYTTRFAPLLGLVEKHRPDVVVLEPGAGRARAEALLAPLASERHVLPSPRSRAGVVVYRLGGADSGRTPSPAPPGACVGKDRPSPR